MKIRVCHFSDWHGMWQELPPAHLYICSGDMLPNSLGHKIDWQYEEKFQSKFMKDNPISIPHYKQQVNPSQVFCVRGNHDHVGIAPLFTGRDIFVREFNNFGYHGIDIETVLNGQLRIFGTRGVKRVHGRGPDELYLEECEAMMTSLRNLRTDILITHGPPKGVLDEEGGESFGSAALRGVLEKVQPKLHCFGHIHESKGIRTLGNTICSNAATGVNVIELNL